MPQPLPQQIGKEPVIAIPLPLVIQRDDEQVGAFEIFQRLLSRTSGVPSTAFAQRAAQAIEDRCAQQERLDVSGCLLKDFFEQIVEDEMMAAGERFDELLDWRPDRPCMDNAANCRPAIQPSVRVSNAAMSSAERFSPITRLRNSAASSGVKPQVGGAQFDQLAADA